MIVPDEPLAGEAAPPPLTELQRRTRIADHVLEIRRLAQGTHITVIVRATPRGTLLLTEDDPDERGGVT